MKKNSENIQLSLSRNENRRVRLQRLCSAYRLKCKELLYAQKEIERRNLELSAALCEAQSRLSQINSEIEEELVTARKIQEGLLPKELPEMFNLKSAAVYIPAGKVGGDLYDIIITPRRKIAVLIYDVSGHGVPAALIGAMAKMLFAHYLEKTDSPSDVFHHVNKDLCRFIRTDQYLTAFLGIIDPVTNVMSYSRAGHVPPLLYRYGSGNVTRLDSKGFFIGHSALLSIADYSGETVHLEPGDKLLFYTDGLTEGYNGRGMLYGVERLKTVFAECGGSDARSVIDRVVEHQTAFREGTPLRDDFTVLCIEVGDSEQLLSESGFSPGEEPSILVLNRLEDIEEVSSVFLREMDRHGFPDQSIKQFKICIFEMLTNAIIHGNGGDPRKKVLLFYKVTDNEAAVSVVDEGKGFDFGSVPDPLLPENLIRDHGRGLFIIRHYLDEVTFNETGNRIMGRKFHRR